MEKKQYPHFRIGTISNLTGVNMQTIRRYDAKGILSGKRDKNSQYRFFDLLELTLLIRTRMYRNYGFSLDEVVDLLNTDHKENRARFLDKKEALQKQIEREKLLLSCMEKQMEYLSQAEYYTTHCEFRMSPELYGIYYYNEDALTGNSEREALLSHWIDQTPFVLPMINPSPSHITGGETQLRVGLCVTRENAELLGLGGDPFSFRIPSFPCIYTMSDCTGLMGYDETPDGQDAALSAIQERSYAHVREFCRQNNVRPKAEIYGSTFFSTRENGRLRHFSHLWIPYERV